MLIIDEADRMIEGGHFKELTYILDYIYLNRNQTITSDVKVRGTEIKVKQGKSLVFEDGIEYDLSDAEDLLNEDYGELIEDEELTKIQSKSVK